MYGSVFHLKVQPGREDTVRQLFERWDREHAPRVQGFQAAYLFKPDEQPDELIAVAIFTDREAYRKNALDPEQDRWYHELRALLTTDPIWEDGEVIQAAR
jgi:heme-degrading monooxygenase HmoA